MPTPPSPRTTQPPTAQGPALQDVAEVLKALGTTADGLDRAEAAGRRERDGLNEIAAEKPPAWPVQLLHAFQAPFNVVLLVLAAVNLFTPEPDYKAATVIAVMVCLSSFLRFWQEFRSGTAAEQLRAMVHTTATVSRPDPMAAVPQHIQDAFQLQHHPFAPRLDEVPLRDLVVGDVVTLSAGDLVPADVRLLTAKDLFISQATLTGEAMPVEKSAAEAAEARKVLDAHGSPLDLPNVCYLGTSVVSGSARAVVVATGARTYLGGLAKQLVGQRSVTAFDKGVSAVSWLLIKFMLVMVPIIFLLNGLTKGDWMEAFLFGVSIAVGLTPEMMPMIITANLARGAVAMSRRKVIVKKLHAIQNLGAMDVLCTDKTGTLTQDKVVLIQHLDVTGEENDEVLLYAYLNSYFQTGLKNLLDRAVLEHENMCETRELTKKYLKYDEVPFDFTRRRMSVVVHEVFKGRDLLLCKGAAEEVSACCTQVQVGEEVKPLTPELRDQALELRGELNSDGLRVIAVAYKQVWSQPGKQYGIADEGELTLVGYIAFLDPPKESAAPALAALARHGVAVKILTGDNEPVARKVCRDVGLANPPTLLGPAIEAMADDQLAQAAEATTLFAKLTPPQKARLIAALKKRGHTVGFLGDGINDAAALREADVGVSVDTGTDIARESADVILLEKSLMVLEEGVILGRQTYGNTIKYIKMAASSNFGNVFSVLAASAWLPFLPMLPIHLLIQNLLYDVSQVGIPFDRMDADYLEKPRSWRADDLGRFMICIGPISSVFDLVTFAVLWFVFGAQTKEQASFFQTGWFVEGLLSQTLIIHMIRTAKLPFVQSTATPPLLWLTVAVMAAGVAIPYTPVGAAVGLVPLPLSYFPWLAAILAGYVVLAQVVKRWYLRRFGMWL